MNLTLLRATAKANRTIGLIFVAIMLMYLVIMLAMFDPEDMEGMATMLEALPREMISIMGVEDVAFMGDLTHFITNFYYTFIAILFPMIYTIILANRLVAKHVDSGSMAYLLSTPHSRVSTVTTQAVYLLMSITILFVIVTVTGIAVSAAMFPGLLDVGGFLLMNLVITLIFYATGAISFFFSCLFDEAKHSVAFGAAVPVAFFIFKMLGNIAERGAWIRRLSLFSLLDPTRILAGHVAAAIVIPALIAVVFFSAAVLVFNRRSLPI